nr:helix-turn-helix domain-containing protein [Ornithinimicrobium sp. HY1793]
MLEHPGAGGLVVIAGGERTWSTAVVEGREDDLPDEVEKALAVVLSPVPSASWQVDALLRRVRDRGFTGLVLAGTLSTSVEALAQRLDLVVLLAEQPIRVAKSAWELVEAPDVLALSVVRRVAQSIEYRADSMEDLLHNVAANVGHGIALVGRDEVVSTAGDPLPESLRSAIAFSQWLDVSVTTDGFAASVPVQSRSRTDLRVVLHSRDSGRAQRTALSTAVEMVMPMVAARLLIDEVEAVSEVSRSSGLLGDFLEAGGASDAETERRMRVRGWRTNGHHIGFRVLGRGRLDPFALLQVVNAHLATIRLDSHATTRGGGVMGWVSFNEAPSPQQVSGVAQDLLDLHQSALASFRVATGVGSLQSGATGLTVTLGEARDAARLASDRERSGWFVHVDRLGLGQLLLAGTTGDSLTRAAVALLSPLSERERETLAVYLDEESSIVATGKRLGLHRNTVTSRVQRIQTLLGSDLSDPETRLALQLAARAAHGSS